jgi:hypothetical protein
LIPAIYLNNHEKAPRESRAPLGNRVNSLREP